MAKQNFSIITTVCSVSHDPSEIIQNRLLFAARET